MNTRLKFRTRQDYRHWLEENYLRDEPIWIEFYKDGTEGITYNEALEESLCFGWIDSLVKKIDERIYVLRFSRRKSTSKWSELNKKKVEELLEKGLMAEPGFKTIAEAKSNGQWDRQDERSRFIHTEKLRKLLISRMENIEPYDNLSDSLKRHYSQVYFSAKRETTRNKRLELILEYIKTRKRFM